MSISRYIVCDSLGQVLRDYIGQFAPDIEEDQVIVEVSAEQSGFDYLKSYYEDGQFLPLPPQPAPYYVFDYSTKQWVDGRTTDSQWELIRQERNTKLAESDWTDTYSAPQRLGQSTYESWQTYRQGLRDVTLQPDPFNIVWPEAPN